MFEALSIEVQNTGHGDFVCDVIYRHPNSNMNNFMEFRNVTIDGVNFSGKFFVIMGGFNLNLVQVQSHKRYWLFFRYYWLLFLSTINISAN